MIPRFKRIYHVTVLEGRGVLLVSEDQDVILKGYAIEKVARLIDGSLTAADIAGALQGHLDATEVHYCLLRLEKDGYITHSPAPDLQDVESFWHQGQLDADRGLANLQQKTVALHPIDDPGLLSPLHDELHKHGIQCTSTSDIQEGDPLKTQHAALHVVTTASYMHPELERYNRTFETSHTPWLLLKPYGKSIWLGPLFHPGQSGCWACLHQRLEKHRIFQRIAEQETGLSAFERHFAHSIPAARAIGINLGVLEILKWLSAEEDHPLKGRIQTVDLHTYETASHTLTKRPQCPVCGSRQHGKPSSQISLRPQIKRCVDDGGYRTAPPETTYRRLAHHVSPITGIVKYVRPVETDHPLVQMYSAGHNLKPVSNQSDDLPAYLRDQSSGKGRSPEQARTSALCEALERYSGIFQGTEYRIEGALEELGDRAIHPNDCMHFSLSQYEQRDAWHKTCDHAFQFVPEPFDVKARMSWTPVASLSNGRERYLPTAYCYYNYKGPFHKQCRPDSNGNAAGNTLEEAILQGLLEIVERDCVSIWWYNRLQRPAVALDSFAYPYFEQLLDHYRTLHRAVWVLDLTTDLGIPTFAALSRRVDRQPEDIILGFGAHLDARLAIQRALTEMNQLLPFVLKENPDGSTQYLYDGKLELAWWQTVRVDDNPFLLPAPSELPHTSPMYSFPVHDNLSDDIYYCLKTLNEKNMDVFVLDQTRPDVGLPVVKVIVPELRIFWRRLGAGRLYDVPVQMGWLDQPTPEIQMNPFPFFL